MQEFVHTKTKYTIAHIPGIPQSRDPVEGEGLFSVDKRQYVQMSSAGPMGCSVTQTESVFT